MGPPSWQAAPSTRGVLEVGPYKIFAKMKGQYSFFPFSTSSNPGKNNSSTDGLSLEFTVFQLFSHVQLSATPWTAARQASLSFTVSQNFLRLMSTELAMPIQLSHPLSPPSPFDHNLSLHQGLSQWVSSLDQVAKVLELQLQHQSFQ